MELIDRQKAIDALFKWYEDEDDDRDAVDIICNLPTIKTESEPTE